MQYIAFDIETTGFLPRVDQIVELAAVKFIDGKPVESFSSLVNPKIPIPLGAGRIHGITDEMVSDQPAIEDVLGKFSEFCDGTPLVAHNAPFDTEFIKADIVKFETLAPRGIILDSCSMARKVIQGCPNYKLGTLVTHLNIPMDGAFHRAEADARFCGQIFGIMLQRIYRAGISGYRKPFESLGNDNFKVSQVIKTFKQLDFLAQL